MNGTRNMQNISAEAVPSRLDVARRDLIALRVKHGADSPIGYRCSNLVELMQMPEIPTRLVARQMADLQRLLGT